MTDVVVTEKLRDPSPQTPIDSYQLELISNSTDRVFGRLIILPEVDIDQKFKCISSSGEESFTYNVHGRVFLDIEFNDIKVEGDTTFILVD
jgi:hypothetical protein